MASDDNDRFPTAHRPWPVPDAPWILFQRWESLLFAHWRVAGAALRDRIPPGLELQEFDGSAWLAITPFLMTGVRPRIAPALPGLSEFPETNVRTYVTDGQKPGVFFFSLDASNPIAVAAARQFYHLPYRHAEMAVEPFGNGTTYRSRRIEGDTGAEFEAYAEPSGAEFRSTPGTVEHFLTERYCLYAWEDGRLYRGEIHHAPWPLHRAHAEIRRNTLTAPLGLSLDENAALLHYSKSLDVRAWAPERVAA